MTINTGLIIVPTIGQVIPEAYLKLAFGKFPSYIGTVTALSDPIPELVPSKDNVLPDLADFMQGLEEEKANQSILYLMNTPNKITTESEQPFILIKDETGNAVLVACIEGEYFAKNKADSAHTDEYHVSETLGAYLRKLYTKVCGGDIQKMEAELKEKDVEDYINGLCANRGVVVICSVLGTVFKYETGNNEMFGDFPWGYVSNKMGFVEKSSKEEIPVAPEQRRGLMSRFSKGKTVPVIASTEPIKQENKGATIANANTDALQGKSDTAVIERPMIAPEPDIIKKGKNAFFAWYDANCTGRPTKDEALAGKAMPANDEWMAKNAGKFGPMKDKLRHFKEKIEESKGALGPYKSFAPIITPKSRTIIKELLESGMVKAITDKAQVLNPDTLRSGSTAAPFSAQIGIKLEDTFRWDREIKKMFIDACLGVTTSEEKVMPIFLAWEEVQVELMKMLVDDRPKPKTVQTVEGEIQVQPLVEDPPTKTGGLAGRFKKKAA